MSALKKMWALILENDHIKSLSLCWLATNGIKL